MTGYLFCSIISDMCAAPDLKDMEARSQLLREFGFRLVGEIWSTGLGYVNVWSSEKLLPADELAVLEVKHIALNATDVAFKPKCSSCGGSGLALDYGRYACTACYGTGRDCSDLVLAASKKS